MSTSKISKSKLYAQECLTNNKFGFQITSFGNVYYIERQDKDKKVIPLGNPAEVTMFISLWSQNWDKKVISFSSVTGEIENVVCSVGAYFLAQI